MRKVDLVNVVEAIPFSNFKERVRIIGEELNKNRYIEIWDGYIYSKEKRK